MNLKTILKSNKDINNEKTKNLIAENFSNFDDLERRILSSVSKIQIDGVESQGNNLLSLLFQLSFREQRPLEISKELIITNYEEKEYPFYFFNIENKETKKTIWLSVNYEKLKESIKKISNGIDIDELFGDAVLEKNLISNKTLPTEDNIRNLLGIESYKSIGQKFSLSQAANSQPGDCNIVNLPTGSGKTLIGWFTHLSIKYSGVTVLILPTVGLEQDQYERAKTYFQKVNSETTVRVLYQATFQNQKNKVIEEIEDGSDLFLITSPDYFENTEINKALKRCAKRGNLKNILIDEAHMIQDWGLDFRPYFLSLVFSIKILFEIAKSNKKEIPKIYLFSGTIDQVSADFFRKAFQFAQRIIFFGSLFIRKEINPRIIKHNYPSFGELVKELSFIIPKPAIIYTDRTTNKVDISGTANELITNLTDNILLNFTQMFTGTISSSEQRKQILYNFSGKHCSKCFDENIVCINHMYSFETSIVIATKAFGLGIDIDGIRSIIHIGLPLNIHEYYQQLGRGGRDGKSMLGLLFYNEKDLSDYKSNNHKIMTWEKILPRWKKMFAGPYRGDIKLDLTAITTELRNIPAQRESNIEYNVAALNFLMLSGLIEKTDHSANYTVKTLVDFNEDVWEKVINKQREYLTKNVYKKDIDLVLHNQSEDLREMFVDYYKFIFHDEMEQVIPRIEKDEVFEIILQEDSEPEKTVDFIENAYYFSNIEKILNRIDIKFKELKTMNIFVNKNYQEVFKYDFKNIKVFVYEFDKYFENTFQYKSTNLINLIIHDQALNFEDLPSGKNIINLLKDDLTDLRDVKFTNIHSFNYL